MAVGVLAVQGDVREHLKAVRRLGYETAKVRSPEDLERLSGIIIPGGESTTISKLLARWDLFQPLRNRVQDGLPVFGTCAGLILLARDVQGNSVNTLGRMNISVVRNGYGRQIESFEENLKLIGKQDQTIEGVFIRAPRITNVKEDVVVLTEHDDQPVLVRQGTALGATFHPELTSENVVHRYFVENVISEDRSQS